MIISECHLGAINMFVLCTGICGNCTIVRGRIKRTVCGLYFKVMQSSKMCSPCSNFHKPQVAPITNDRVLCFCYSHMHIANDVYHIHTYYVDQDSSVETKRVIINSLFSSSMCCFLQRYLCLFLCSYACIQVAILKVK